MTRWRGIINKKENTKITYLHHDRTARKLMSRHKFNLIDECKNNRVKNVIFAFIRALATRGRDGVGRLNPSGPAWARRRGGRRAIKFMSRHKLNLIEECKNNRVKNVILAFIRASVTRGLDEGGRLDVVGASVGWTTCVGDVQSN